MTLATALLLLASTRAVATTANGSAPDCGNETTVLEYDLKAEQDESAARRYRNWANSERMLGSSAFGKRFTVRYFEERAHELDLDAERNRALAAEHRRQPSPEAEADGCDT
jgi:hypothetical protein